MSVFRDLERRIDDQLRKLFSGTATAGHNDQRRELIEIQRGVLEDIADRAQLLPRARRVLPFNQVDVRIPAPDEERKTALKIVFMDGDSLEAEVKAHLRREQIEFPADLRLAVEAIEEELPELAAKGYHLVFRTREETAPGQRTETIAPAARSARFIVIAGTATAPEFDFAKRRIQIGRTAEVLDDHRRLVRRNDIAFEAADDEVNATVSRAHAHIEHDAASGEFRLFDDGSAYGTSVLQEGRLVNVPKAGLRGLRLSPGDEIYFGQARVRFEIA